MIQSLQPFNATTPTDYMGPSNNKQSECLLCFHVLIIVNAGLRRRGQLVSHGLDELLSDQLKDGALQYIGLSISLQAGSTN